MNAHHARMARAALEAPITTTIRTKRGLMYDPYQLGKDRAEAKRQRALGVPDESTGPGTSKIATPRKALVTERVRTGWASKDEIYFSAGHSREDTTTRNDRFDRTNRTGTNTWRDVKTEHVKSGRRSK